MSIIKIDQTMWDVIEHPENYEIEVCATSLDLIKDISRKLYNMQKNVEYRIMMEMEQDEATKLQYLNVAGEPKVVTLKPGAMKSAVDNAEDVIREHGFDPNELGSYHYKVLPWSKLKEMRKLGGGIKELIDKLYIRGKKTLSIGDK